MQDIIAALISLFLIEPVQAHIAERYADLGVSTQAAAEAASCFSKATPGILKRAGSDPAWAVAHAVGYWTGVSSIDEIVLDAAPDCAGSVETGQDSAPRAQGQPQ